MLVLSVYVSQKKPVIRTWLPCLVQPFHITTYHIHLWVLEYMRNPSQEPRSLSRDLYVSYEVAFRREAVGSSQFCECFCR